MPNPGFALPLKINCASTARHSLSSSRPSGAKPCQDGQVLAGQAYNDQHLYDGLIDAFSMRGFMPSSGVTGHDHFFDAFDKFSGTDPRHEGEWLDEIATRASAQNEQYLELMETPDFRHAVAIAKEVGWRDDLAQLRDQLLSRGLRDEVAVDRAQFDRAAALRSERERCGQPDALPACRVEIRYLYQILRDFPKEQVFAQTLLGFETASADPRIVGINYVMPEDGTISMADYALQMRMVGFLLTFAPPPGMASACTPANSRRAWCRMKVSAVTFDSPSSKPTRNASATVWM